MLTQIKGLHHITSLASDARANNGFFTDTLGLRRVKKTVNFDAPDVYHLYYGDEAGSPGSVMTYFPFPAMPKGAPGTGEVATTRFSIPPGSASRWAAHLSSRSVADVTPGQTFDAVSLGFAGPDGERFELIETDDDRAPWIGGGIGADMAIRGFHSVALRLRDPGATRELLTFMGYDTAETQGDTIRMVVSGDVATVIDLETAPSSPVADQGAGSVHHVAFAVENRARQIEVREALLETGYQVTPVIDRDYFWAIYFRAPGGVLFEIATNEPGFGRDEDMTHLGEALKLPSQHEHLRARLERTLPPIGT